MPANVLVSNAEKYGGSYVAKKSFKSKTVIAFGADPVKVSEEARQKGAKDPVVFYVPEKGMVHIYPCL
jgi:hypothetical protein